MTTKDKLIEEQEFLQWIHDRMIKVHGENENVDFLHRFRSLIAGYVIKAKCLDTHDEIIDSLLNAELSTETFTVKMPKTKTVYRYELVTDLSISEIAKAMIDGEVFHGDSGSNQYAWIDGSFLDEGDDRFTVEGDFYRRIEKTITERDEFMDEAVKVIAEAQAGAWTDGYMAEMLFDAGCRFNV